MDWENLVENYSDSLLLYVRQWCPSLNEAEDIVQQTYLRFWQRYTKHPQKINEPSSYLFSIARTVAIDYARSSLRRRRREAQIGELLENNNWFEFDYSSDDESELMALKLKELPLEQREVIIMKIWGELTFEEISKSLKISIGTITSRYRYGLEKLKHLLTTCEG